MKCPDSSLCPNHGTPKAGPGRRCGISGTADTHEYHLERLVKKCLIERGYPEIIDEEGAYPEQPLDYFIVQIDKSTCQSYNLKESFFGYRCVPTSRTQLLLEELSDKRGVFIVYRSHNSRLGTCVWWNLSCTHDTAVLHASASSKYGGGYRRKLGSTIYPGLVRWNRWWTRLRFGKRVWLWVELENFPFQTFFIEKHSISEYYTSWKDFCHFFAKICL